MGNNIRCVICNKVSSIEIETDLGDFLGGWTGQEGKFFFPDPKNRSDFICLECKSEIDDCMYEYHVYDLDRNTEKLEDAEKRPELTAERD